MHAGGTMGDRGPQAASQLIRAVLTCETDGPQHPCHASGWFSAICTFSLGDYTTTARPDGRISWLT